MKATVAIFGVALPFIVSAQPASNSNGSISGSVIDEGGRPIPLSKMHYFKSTRYGRNREGQMMVVEQGFHADTQARADGSFTLLGLTPGRYGLCAQGTQPNQVSGCEWDGVPLVELSVGQAVQGITRRLLEGRPITIRVADPAGKIAVPDATGRVRSDRKFFVGVSVGSYYKPAQRVSASANEHVFRVVVPKRISVRLFIDSELPVTDATGASVETKRPTTMQIGPSSLTEILIALKVN